MSNGTARRPSQASEDALLEVFGGERTGPAMGAGRARPKMRLLDRYHVDDRLAASAEAVEREPRARHSLLQRWRKTLDRSDTAIQRICKAFDERLHGPVPDGYREDDEVPWGRPRLMHGQPAREAEGLAYFENNASRIRYATARERGFRSLAGSPKAPARP